MTTPIPYNQLTGPEIDAMVAKILGVEANEWRIYTPGKCRVSDHVFSTKSKAIEWMCGVAHGYEILPTYPPYHRSVDACLEGLEKARIHYKIQSIIGNGFKTFVVLRRKESYGEATDANRSSALCIAIMRFNGMEVIL